MAEGPAAAARAAGSGRDVATGGAVGEYCELPPNRVGAGCIGLKCSNRSRLCFVQVPSDQAEYQGPLPSRNIVQCEDVLLQRQNVLLHHRLVQRVIGVRGERCKGGGRVWEERRGWVRWWGVPGAKVRRSGRDRLHKRGPRRASRHPPRDAPSLFSSTTRSPCVKPGARDVKLAPADSETTPGMAPPPSARSAVIAASTAPAAASARHLNHTCRRGEVGGRRGAAPAGVGGGESEAVFVRVE